MNSQHTTVRVVGAEDSQLRINADGLWFYENTPLERLPLLRLFYSVLRQKGDKYYICTPVEEVEVAVEDAPYVVMRFEQVYDSNGNNEHQAQEIRCILNDETSVPLDNTCSARILANNALYMTLPNGFSARFIRSAFIDICRFLHDDGEQGTYRLCLPSGVVVPITVESPGR